MCVACSYQQGGSSRWIPAEEVFGLPESGRPKSFQVKRKKRWETFKRDHFCCVYCGQAAPAVATIEAYLEEQLRSQFGVEASLEHSKKCGHCGHTLPGIIAAVPVDVMRRMSFDAREHIVLMLHRLHHDVEHPIDVDLYRGQRLSREEFKFATEEFIVTGCFSCNQGKRGSLESIEFLRNLYANHIAARDKSSAFGLIDALHFRARMGLRSKAG